MFLFWFRWVLVLPAAFIGSVLGQWFVTAMLLGEPRFTGLVRGSLITILFKEAVSNGSLGYLFVGAGTLTAPNNKLKTSAVLCVIGMAYAIVFLFTAQRIPLGWRIYSVVSLAIGCLLGAAHMHERFCE